MVLFFMRFSLAFLCLPLLAGARAAERSETLLVCDDTYDNIVLDPQKEFIASNQILLQQIFDGLVRFGPEGRLEPALATEWRRIDDLTWEFKLRSGVVFHGGEPFDAEAVKFSIERYLDPKIGFPGIVYLNSIDKVEIADAFTVRIKTKFPDGLLLHRLASIVLIVSPRSLATNSTDGYATHPIGTGPYRFVKWEKGQQLVLEANPDYWVRGLPKFRRLVFKFLPLQKQVEALLQGETDIVLNLPGTQTMKVAKSRSAKVVKKETLCTFASNFNNQTGPLADRRVRQALNYAVNKDDLVRFDLLGNGKPLASLTMPGEVGHDPSLRPYPYDPNKARGLLKEAGFPHGLNLKALINDSREGARTSRIIASQLAKVGVRLELSSTTDGDAPRDARNRRDIGFAVIPDPMAHSFFIQSIALFSRSPFSIVKDDTFDGLLQKMVMTLDLKEQDRAGRELDRYVHDEALGIFTYQRIATYGVSKKVHFTPSITGMPFFFLSYPERTEARHPQGGPSRS